MQNAKQTFMEVECDIRQLMYRDTELHDSNQYDEMIKLFTDDAVYVSPFRGELTGKQAIYEGIAKRPKNRLARHLLTNVMVEQHSETEASSRCYLVAAANDNGYPLEKAVPRIGVPLVGEHLMKFRREDGVWKISRKETVGVFAGQQITF